MKRIEGHYTIKEVLKLPKRGNKNFLYIIRNEKLDKFYRFLPNSTWEEIEVGGPGGFVIANTSDLVNDGEFGFGKYIEEGSIFGANGLSDDGAGEIIMGGSIDRNTFITVDSGTYAMFDQTVGGGLITVQGSNANFGKVEIGVQGGSAFLRSGIRFFEDRMIIEDDDSVGIQYDADYSANYTARTLVDKQYADAVVESVTGWAQYNDNQYTPGAPLVISVAAGATTVDINGATTIKSQLPTGISDFYDVATSKITPDTEGDGYAFTFSFKGSSSANNGSATIGIDIGGTIGQIFKRNFRFPRGTGTIHEFSFTSQGYALGTFIANGGILKITSNVGTSSLHGFSLQVHRTHKGRPVI